MRHRRWYRPLAAILLLDLTACYTYKAVPLSPNQEDAERTRPMRVTYARGQKVEGPAIVDDMATVVLSEHWVVGDTLWGIRSTARAAGDTIAIPLAAVHDTRSRHLHVGNTVMFAATGLVVVGAVAAAVAVSQMCVGFGPC